MTRGHLRLPRRLAGQFLSADGTGMPPPADRSWHLTASSQLGETRRACIGRARGSYNIADTGKQCCAAFKASTGPRAVFAGTFGQHTRRQWRRYNGHSDAPRPFASIPRQCVYVCRFVAPFDRRVDANGGITTDGGGAASFAAARYNNTRADGCPWATWRRSRSFGSLRIIWALVYVSDAGNNVYAADSTPGYCDDACGRR